MKELRLVIACTRVFLLILYPRDGGSILFQNITRFLPLHNLYSHRSENVKLAYNLEECLKGRQSWHAIHLCSCDLFPYISQFANSRSLGQGSSPSSEEPACSTSALTTTRVWTISPVCKLKIYFFKVHFVHSCVPFNFHCKL
jgi:hypothetical protein